MLIRFIQEPPAQCFVRYQTCVSAPKPTISILTNKVIEKVCNESRQYPEDSKPAPAAIQRGEYAKPSRALEPDLSSFEEDKALQALYVDTGKLVSVLAQQLLTGTGLNRGKLKNFFRIMTNDKLNGVLTKHANPIEENYAADAAFSIHKGHSMTRTAHSLNADAAEGMAFTSESTYSFPTLNQRY
jgi:hypothetical protein